MNRHRFINNYKLPPIFWSCVLSWSTWSEVCDFVTRPTFKVGVYLDDQGNPIKGTSDKMGLLLNGENGDVLIKEGETIGYAFGRYWRSTPTGWEKI